MAEGKESFILYRDLIHTVRKMPRELRGDLFLHILEYVNDTDPKTDDPILEIAFEPIKQQLKRDLKKWEKRSNKNRENALIRWHANASERMQPMQTDAKHADSDSDSVNDTVSDNVTPKRGSNRFSPPSTDEVDTYFLEKGLTFHQAKKESEKFVNYYEANGWKVGKNKMQKWKAAAGGWINRLSEFEKEKISGQKEKVNAGELLKQQIYGNSKI